MLLVVVVWSLSCVQLFAIPWTAACQASLSFTISSSLLRFMYTESVMLSNHLTLCCLLPSCCLLLSFCLQYFPASGSFPMSQLFTSGGQSTGTWASVSVRPMNIQGWLLGVTSLVSLHSKRLSRVFSSTRIFYEHLSISTILYHPKGISVPIKQ